MESVIKNAAKVDLSAKVPPTAIAVTIRADIEPSTGRIFIYSPADIDRPVMFDGPSSTREVPLAAEKVIFVQKLSGTTKFRLSYPNWTDDL
jgi:hypothetical protein